MSATDAISTPQVFLDAAEDLEACLLAIQERQERAKFLVDYIADLAGMDDNGGLPRLGFAVRAEALSLAGVIRDRGLDWGDEQDLKDIRDLRALIALAVKERGAS